MEYSLNKKGDHSLGPDFFTGWKLTATSHKFTHIPLYFTNTCADHLSKTLTSFGSQQPHRVVYMGPRHTSNYRAFKAYSRGETFEDSLCKQQEDMYGQFLLKFDFKHSQEKEKVFPIRALQYRLFTGMNPTIKKEDLRFDSNFECGNLDLAISITSFEFDLLMRVDSNTKGHTTWFYFKVSNFTGQQKVKFNLINFQKSGLMYKEGMRPYCYRSSVKKWVQEGSNLEYRPKKFRYSFQPSQTSYFMNCLSFVYQFSSQDEYVYFAYCIPYTYSYLMHRVTSLQKENPHFVQLDRSYSSAGGLQIPLLTITNSNGEREKPTCLAIGRLHPGQTQGSWVMDGFLKFLCSPKGYFLRERMVFKIVPMANVDGVVLGNFRTGIGGRDLNRVFDQPQNYPEINMIREIAQKSSPLVFLDFHGHSAKKNVFMYGPDYGVDNKHYLASRLLPKFISKLTQVFRFYSCIFRISQSKVNAARSIILREHNVTFSFTIQSSSFAYGAKNSEVRFTREEYCLVGEKITEGLEKFIKILVALPKRLENKQQSGAKNEKEQKEEKKQEREQKQQKRLSPKRTKAEKKQEAGKLSNLFDFRLIEQLLGPAEKGLLEELMSDQKDMDQPPGSGDEKEDSDFEDGADYSEKELEKMFTTQIQDEIPVQIIKKKKKNRKLKQKQRTEEEASPTQRSSISPTKNIQSNKVFKKQMSDLSQRINKIHYNQRTLKISEKSQEKLPEIKRGNQALDQMSADEYELINQNLNRVYYNNWKRELTPFENLQKKYKKASSSLNHVTLNYDTEKEREEEYEIEKKRKLEREKNLRMKFNRERDLEKYEKKKIQRNHSLKSQLQQIGDKQFLLPLLEKNKSLNLNNSPVDQLLANHQKIQRNFIRKNIKIVYF